MPFNLNDLTGLEEEEIADVLLKNPRAYMAFKGAIAERHLSKKLEHYKDIGLISEIRTSQNDSDKDFYITHEETVYSVECKNVEVLKITKKDLSKKYIIFLFTNAFLSEQILLNKIHDVDNTCNLTHLTATILLDYLNTLRMETIKNLYKKIDQQYVESGLYRYMFSQSLLSDETDNNHLTIFGDNKLSIDFQRTRNATNDGDTGTKNRFYEVGEVDIVAVCLFSRTLEWEFIYAKAENLARSNVYPDRYHNSVKILNHNFWHRSLENVLI